MKIKVVWYLLIKMAGLWFLYNAFHFMFMYSSDIIFMYKNIDDNIYNVFISSIIMAFYTIVGFLMIYKTSIVISALDLMKGMEDESFNIETNRVTFVKLFIFLFAIILLTISISEFCLEIYRYYQQDIFFNNNPESKYIIFYGVKAFLAYLILTNLTFLTNFIESKLKQNPKDIDDSE